MKTTTFWEVVLEAQDTSLTLNFDFKPNSDDLLETLDWMRREKFKEVRNNNKAVSEEVEVLNMFISIIQSQDPFNDTIYIIINSNFSAAYSEFVVFLA